VRDDLRDQELGFMRRHDRAGCQIRLARVTDAEAMGALYRETYPTVPGLPAGSGYPFPQYMSSAWLARSLTQDEFCWIVATRDGDLVGCLGAATNISLPGRDDRVAEFTGLVVKEHCRGRGIGLSLLKAMSLELEDAGAAFLLAETRTGNLGGFKGTLKAGFIPIGFEPFAHNMLGRLEPMIMMGKPLPSAFENRTLAYQTSPQAHRLGSASLRLLREPMPPSDTASRYRTEFADETTAPPVLKNLNIGSSLSCRLDLCEGLLMVEQVTSTIYDRYLKLAGLKGHCSGIVCLRRIQGFNPEAPRFLERYYAIRLQNEVLGVAHVSVDLQDNRARILRLEVQFDGLQGLFVCSVLGRLQVEAPMQRLACAVVDVRADFAPLHASLGAIGFFPTVYYPGFVAMESGRVDAVQFTRVVSDDQYAPDKSLSELASEVGEIIRIVVASREEARGSSQPSSVTP
jgi:ribosomal protein S18 acetylase RimI-like enzyme